MALEVVRGNHEPVSIAITPFVYDFPSFYLFLLVAVLQVIVRPSSGSSRTRRWIQLDLSL